MFDFKTHLDYSHVEGMSVYHKKNYRDVLNLSSNELIHEDIDKFFKEFLHTHNFCEVYRYPYFHFGEQVLADFFGINSEQILLTAGSDDGIKLIVSVLTRLTRLIILQVPNYENYKLYCHLNSVNITQVEWYFDNSYFIEQLFSCIQQSPPSLVILANPNSWTGRCLELDVVYHLSRLCHKHNHLLLIDEAYIAFSMIDHLSLLSTFPNVLLIRSFSKAFGLAGFRIGAILGSKTILDYLKIWRPSNGVSHFSMQLLIYCLQKYEVWRKMQKDIIQCRLKVVTQLTTLFPDWTIDNTHTNFIVVNTRCHKQLIYCLSFLQKKQIIVKDLSSNSALKSHFRMTIPSQRMVVKLLECMEELKKKLDGEA